MHFLEQFTYEIALLMEEIQLWVFGPNCFELTAFLCFYLAILRRCFLKIKITVMYFDYLNLTIGHLADA